MNRTTRARIVWLMAVVAVAACSPRSSEAPKTASSAAVAPPAAQNPTFNLSSAWLAKQVVIKPVASPGEQAMSYTLTPKKAAGYVAIELTMTSDAAVPISANYSKLVLIDAAGARYNSFMEYPSEATEISDDRQTISFTDDPSKLINGKLRDMGGKLIVTFEAPPNTAGMKLEVPGGAMLDVSLKP